MWLRFRVIKAVDKVSSELQFHITRTRTPMVKQAGDQFNTDQVLLEQAVMGRWRQTVSAGSKMQTHGQLVFFSDGNAKR